MASRCSCVETASTCASVGHTDPQQKDPQRRAGGGLLVAALLKEGASRVW